jgi:glycosyltransferase involved in cell wall biosynthesis
VACLILSTVRRRTLVYESHEYWAGVLEDRPMTRTVVRLLERAACRRSAFTIVVNDLIADEMATAYGSQRPIVVQNATGIELVDGIGTRSSNQPLNVLYHGIVAPNRGLEQLIRATSMTIRPCRLVIRGDGPLVENLRLLADHLEIADRVEFAPAVPLDLLVVAASRSDVGVWIGPPTPNNLMSLPNKIFEYLAAGLAIISSDFPEISRLLEETNAGFVCRGTDEEQVAEYLDLLASDDRLLESKRKAALLAAQTTCSWSAQEARLIDALTKLAP